MEAVVFDFISYVAGLVLSWEFQNRRQLERNRAQSVLAAVVKDERVGGGGLQEIWNAGQARQHTQISLLVLGMQWSEEKITSKEMNMARNHSSHWLQDLFSWLMRPNAEQKHSAIGRFVPGALYVRLWCVLWIKVKVPQNYVFHAASKIHPSLPN